MSYLGNFCSAVIAVHPHCIANHPVTRRAVHCLSPVPGWSIMLWVSGHYLSAINYSGSQSSDLCVFCSALVLLNILRRVRPKIFF